MGWQWYDYVIWWVGLAIAYWIGSVSARSQERSRCFRLAMDAHRQARSPCSWDLVISIDDGKAQLIDSSRDARDTEVGRECRL